MNADVATAAQVGPRLDRLPVSPFHWRLLRLIGYGMFLDAFEIYLAGGVLGALVKEGWSDLAGNANFISATFVGMVIGTWLAGVLGDRYGRRFSYQLNLLIFGIASLAGAAAPSMGWLIAARLFMGIGLGAEIVVGYATLTEFVPPTTRGRWLSGLSICTNAALFVSSLLGYVVIPNLGWRTMFVIAGVGALIVWQLRKAMPESPRWLEAQGRHEEAEKILSGFEAEAAAKGPLPPVTASGVVGIPTRKIGELFSGDLLRRTIAGGVLCIAISVALYGLIAWLPTFFVKQGYSIASSLGFTTLMSLGGPCGAAVGYLLADRFPRRTAITGTVVTIIVLAIAYSLSRNEVLFVTVGFALVTAIYFLVALGWALYVPELFPTDLRMRGTGVSNTAGRLATIATPSVVVPIFNSYALPGVLGLVGVVMAIACVVVLVWGPEMAKKPL
jgi:putative MFS transporter